MEGVNYNEVVLYIALNKTQERIGELKVAEMCPQRRHRRGQRPNITGNGTEEKEDKRYAPWIMPDTSTFTNEEERKLLTIALKIAISAILKNHIYKFDEKLYRQTSGGAIGLELTGEIAKVYMAWWDKQFLKKLDELGILQLLYKRYVDDINTATVYLGYGCVRRENRNR